MLAGQGGLVARPGADGYSLHDFRPPRIPGPMIPMESASLEGFPVVFEVEPRFRDTDAMGHLNHVVYITYFEVARTRYWTALTGDRDYGAVPFILAHVTADYRSPAYVKEILRIGVRVSRLGGRSFECQYRIEEAASGRLVVEGSSVQVIFDYQRQQSAPIPEDLKDRIRRFEGRADL
jgi:acyl-CoA thioester hydrolase